MKKKLAGLLFDFGVVSTTGDDCEQQVLSVETSSVGRISEWEGLRSRRQKRRGEWDVAFFCIKITRL